MFSVHSSFLLRHLKQTSSTPYNTESVANFSRVSLLKWPRFLDLSRTAPDLEAEVVSSFAPPSRLSECEDSIGALQGDRTHTSLERDMVAEDPAFNSRFGDVVEVSETERNEAQEDDKENLEGEEVTVLEPVPRELEVLGVAITQQARPQRRRKAKATQKGGSAPQLPTIDHEGASKRTTG